MNATTRICLLAACALVLAVGPAMAHEIDGPSIVEADGAGHFAYEITVVISESVDLGSIQILEENTDLSSSIADYFCQVTVEAGTYVVPFEGNLSDAGLDGSILYEESYCDGWTGTVDTTILAPTVGTEERSWSAVKGFYR